MPLVGIIGTNGKEMERAFLRMSQGNVSCYHITQPPTQKVNVLVATEVLPVLSRIIPALEQEDYLIINSDDKEIFPLLSKNKAKLITYGFNNRACITASSVTDENLQVCIQRAFYGIDGEEREPQEFPTTKRGESTESVLAAAAAWSVCERYEN